MQTLNIVRTLNYDLDCYKISTDDKITTTKNVCTSSTVDDVLTFFNILYKFQTMI